MYAAQKGHLHVVGTFLERGAEVNQQNEVSCVDGEVMPLKRVGSLCCWRNSAGSRKSTHTEVVCVSPVAAGVGAEHPCI